jgi:hypothetical protein
VPKQQPPDDTGSQEFYVIDENGKKSDAALHAHILTPVDGTIDQEVLAKIREKAKAKKPSK